MSTWLSLDLCGKPDRYPVLGKRKVSVGFFSKGKIQILISMCLQGFEQGK